MNQKSSLREDPQFVSEVLTGSSRRHRSVQPGSGGGALVLAKLPKSLAFSDKLRM
jgi:hypothetical protein